MPSDFPKGSKGGTSHEGAPPGGRPKKKQLLRCNRSCQTRVCPLRLGIVGPFITSHTDTILFAEDDADDEYEFDYIPDLVWEQVDEIALNKLNGVGGE